MKIFSLIVTIALTSLNTYSQKNNCDVNTFYRSITKESGKDLHFKLNQLLKNTHRSISYDDLHKAYMKTDLDKEYEGDRTILDMYSERPNKKDSYSYKPGKLLCGNIHKEGDCYNREHLFPQGLFNKRRPMKTDIYHVFPTDGKVNRLRDSYPFGVVSEVETETSNGSKLGYMHTKAYRGKVFEPIDEFKGDIARAMLYFAVRYKSILFKVKRTPMVHRGEYSPWFLKLMIKWHKQDPVSQHERRRNNLACDYQHNRNPFIDNPEWVSAIWEAN